MRPFRSILRFPLLAALFWGAASSSVPDLPVNREYEVKAAFLYNFAKFVEWPEARFATPEAPIVIGVLARNPFGAELARLVAGRRINGRAIVVRLVPQVADAAAVHLLFVPEREESGLEFGAWATQPPAVVTVGESARFAEAGGMITFITEADKIRFTINLASTERADLKLSAQLLKLASAVRRTK